MFCIRGESGCPSILNGRDYRRSSAFGPTETTSVLETQNRYYISSRRLSRSCRRAA